MDKFKALEPVRLHSSDGRAPRAPPRPLGPLIGRVPLHVHAAVLSYASVPDIPSYARTCRALARLAHADALWSARYAPLSSLTDALDVLDTRARGEEANKPPTLAVSANDNDGFDDFGDFSSASQSNAVDLLGAGADEMGDFVAPSFFAPAPTPLPAVTTPLTQFRRAHQLLKPLTPALLEPPHLILGRLFSGPALGLQEQARVLHALFLYLSPDVAPLRRAESLLAGLRAAADRFDAALLTAFEEADSRDDEDAMRAAASASWEVWAASRPPLSTASASRSPNRDISFTATLQRDAEWEMGRVWAEKREIFYTAGGRFRPGDNFTEEGKLDFGPMDGFMVFVIEALREHGERAVRVFPPASRVLVSFADRLANEVVGEYITPLLTQARALQTSALFLRATAAAFREAWRLVDALRAVASTAPDPDALVTQVQAEDVVYRMFEPNMDEYLDEEVETLKHAFDATCRQWDKEVARASGSHTTVQTYNKRSVLSSFTDVLLLPVTIVPRTVGGAAQRVGGAAVQGIAMLDPRRWGADASASGAGADGAGYKAQGEAEPVVWANEDDEDEEDEKTLARMSSVTGSTSFSDRGSVASFSTLQSASGSNFREKGSSKEKDKGKEKGKTYDNLQLLLSLDVTLELIHSARDSLKRAETFVGYPVPVGPRVQSTVEDVAAEMLITLAQRHVKPGFEAAIKQMRTYEPPAVGPAGVEGVEADGEGVGEKGWGEKGEKVSTSVAPLVQFFELVHIGDMIQSIVQVYFDKELAPHVDTTDFLNTVVREKKRFENVLDDSVAQGLNAGIEVLMNQVDHIILALTPPRAYYPPEDAPLLLGPSAGCTAAIRCLENHISLLKGNVNREVLEVFETELGVRLIGILQKHIKRQIISLSGGFQVIADLNAYHAFIASLKIPSLTADFANLKMLGHVYIVEDAKDLAQIVRDVTRYGGAYRPEDIYEFVQRRSDWKRIEKVVDKTMYNLNLREDCVIC
ncbi:unnamed protein product [Peniophora sp. CBMAI 1063]|nr:unnamed protein product [Peniophora sp. CBMAI 1063]